MDKDKLKEMKKKSTQMRWFCNLDRENTWEVVEKKKNQEKLSSQNEIKVYLGREVPTVPTELLPTGI